LCQHLPGETEKIYEKSQYKEPITRLKFETGIIRIESLESYRYNISFNSWPDGPILISIDEADERDESKA
jgi:hypothetical protein